MAMVRVPFIALPFVDSLIACIILMIIAGIALGMIGPMMMTVEAERVPADMRGRVFGASRPLPFVRPRSACSLPSR